MQYTGNPLPKWTFGCHSLQHHECRQGTAKEPHYEGTESGGEHVTCVSFVLCVCASRQLHIMQAYVCMCVCTYVPTTIHRSFLCSCCSRFEAEEARKLRVAVGSFLDLITLTIDTMDQFGWLLYRLHAFTQLLHCMAFFCTVCHAWLLYILWDAWTVTCLYRTAACNSRTCTIY